MKPKFKLCERFEGLCSVSMSIKEPPFMTEIEDHEMNEAAMSLVMFSKRVFDFDSIHDDVDDFMDLDQLKDCVESMLDFREMVSNSGFEKSSNCSDVVALRSKLQSKSSHRCMICGKSFECYQALGGHQRLHRPIKGKLARKREYYKDDNSLFDSSEPSRVEEKILDCVELKQDFGELVPLNRKLQKRPESSSSYKCKICGKSFGCFQALGGHKGLHRSIKGELARTEDDNSLSHSSEAKKIVSEPSKFEVSQEKILHCVESKQDFSELLSHSGVDKSSSHRPIRGKLSRKRKYTEDDNPLFDSSEDKKIVLQPSSFEVSQGSCSALPFTLRSRLQKKTQSNSSCDCKICGKSFECYQALGGHQRLHRPIRGKLVCKRENVKDDNSLFYSSEAKKIVSKPSNYEISQEEKKILDCVESEQDFDELLFLNSKSQKTPESSCSYDCKICGKSFESFQALGGHTTLHRSIKGQLARTEDYNSLSHSLEAKKNVSQPSRFEVSQEKILHCFESNRELSELLSYSGFDKYSNCSKTRFFSLPSQPSSFEVSQEKILHCVESKQDFSELFSHSGFDESSDCSKARFIPLPSSLRSKSHSSISIKEQLARKNEKIEDGYSMFGVTDYSEASKIVSIPSSFEVFHEEKILH